MKAGNPNDRPCWGFRAGCGGVKYNPFCKDRGQRCSEPLKIGLVVKECRASLFRGPALLEDAQGKEGEFRKQLFISGVSPGQVNE